LEEEGVMTKTLEVSALEVRDTFECPLSHTPNVVTLAAMQEVQDMIDGKLPRKHFKSLEEFWEDLDS
jgi:hypothetical protein